MDRDALEVNLGDDLMVQVCVTRTLPPALTLELGLESLKEAVNELKTNPPQSSSGVLRFQVRVFSYLVTSYIYVNADAISLICVFEFVGGCASKCKSFVLVLLSADIF